jgi:hypothetical protein
MREIYWPDWFARVGAIIEDDAVANVVYRAGLWNEALAGGPNAGDETIIGWAGTLDRITPVDPVLLQRVQTHLQKGFFRRRSAAASEMLGTGPPTRRIQAGMLRLRKIDQVSRASRGPRR